MQANRVSIIMLRIYSAILLVLLLGSCGSDSATRESLEINRSDSLVAAVGFDTSYHYTQSVCLQFRGKPLLTVGSRVAELDSALWFRFDPNSGYNYEYPRIVDYLSMNDEFWIPLQECSANGIIYFSADRKGRIFELRGSWLIDADTSQQTTQAAVQAVVKRLFPCINRQPPLNPKQKTVLSGPQFDEIFELHTPDTTGFPEVFPYLSCATTSIEIEW